MKQLKALATLATLAEAKNYLGEKEYTTWKSWKAAVKKANPAAWIEGDEDIAQAMVGPKPYKRGETKAIGEWGGDVGSIFKVDVKEALEKETKQMPNGVRPKGIGWSLKKAGEQSGKDFSVWERTTKSIEQSGRNAAEAGRGPSARDVKESTITEARVPSWFKKGAKVKLAPDYVDKDPDEVFTLVSADEEDGRGRIEDENGRGWDIRHYQVYSSRGKPPVNENTELQSLGKELKAKPVAPVAAAVPASDEPETPAETAAETPADETAEEAAPEFKVGDVVVPSKGPHKGEKHEVIRVRDDGRIDIKPQGIEGEAVKYRNGGAIAKPEDLVLAEGYAAQFKGFKLFKQGSLLTQVSVDLVEATDAKTMSKAKVRIKEITKEMDAIIDGGGRVLENDPLMQELRALRRKISSLKKVSEAVKSTADDLDEKHEKWKSDVLAAHPDVAAKIKFKSRIEQGKDTTSAEIGDRSYGVFDNDTGKAVVFKIDESTFKIDPAKNTLDNLEAFAGIKLKSGKRNVVKGFPFDIDGDSDVDNVYVEAVDLAACTGLMKALRAAGFRVKRDGDTKLEIEVYHLAD